MNGLDQALIEKGKNLILSDAQRIRVKASRACSLSVLFFHIATYLAL